jgi:adenylate kinase
MKLVLIGIQGSGKSTQGNLLSRQLKIPYLSTGHIFRAIAKEKTPLGKQVKLLINSGALIPDNKVIEIVNSYLSKPVYRKGYILDGFPRTLTQAKKFINNVDNVIHVDIPDKEALWRLAYRNEQRDDNTIDAIKKRIELFKKFTTPVLSFYKRQKKLVTIDGTQSIEEVNEEILKHLGRQVISNRIRAWKQRKKNIVAIVGLPGSGKTEAAKYYKKRGLPVISFSDVVNTKINRMKLPHTLEVHKKVRQDLRDKYGFEAMAYLNKQKIDKELLKNNTVIVEGMRSWEEYEYLRHHYPKVKLTILALHADKPIRFDRISNRKDRNELKGEERDIDELLSTHMGPTIAFADYVIKNNWGIEELHQKLDEVYREIYFS